MGKYHCPSCPVDFDKPGQCDTLGCGKTLVAYTDRPAKKPKEKK